MANVAAQNQQRLAQLAKERAERIAKFNALSDEEKEAVRQENRARSLARMQERMEALPENHPRRRIMERRIEAVKSR